MTTFNELSEDRQRLVTTLASVVRHSGSNDDLIPLLENTDWDLEPAILNYINRDINTFYETLRSESQRTAESRHGVTQNENSVPMTYSWLSNIFGGAVGAASSASDGATNSNSNTADDDNIMPGSFPQEPAPRSRFSDALITIVATLFVMPLLLLFKLIPIIVSPILGTIWKTKTSVFGMLSKHGAFPPSSSKIPNPIDSAVRFSEQFEDDVKEIGGADEESRLGSVTKPNFLQKGYTQALYLAKSEASWLLVYIQDDDHDDKQKFIEKILLNQRFNKYITDNNIAVWGGNCRNSEAFQAANSLGCTKYPFMALLCLTSQSTPTTNGVEHSTPTLNVVCRVQGYHPMKKILVKFTQQIEKYEPNLASIRASLQQQQMTRLLREQQDLAYQRSVLQDKLKKQRRMMAQVRNRQLRLFIAYKLQQWDSLVKTGLDENDDKKQFARIAVRLTSEKRVVRYFKRTLAVDDLYLYIDFVGKGIIDSSGEVDFNGLNAYCNSLNTGIRFVDFNEEELAKAALEFPKEECDAKSLGKVDFKLWSVFPKKELVFGTDMTIESIEFLNPDGNLVVESS